ncbi:MAG: aldo/keto reductase [FCB group bacterium]|jgi:predicted aldo/keto reductase-like oxidoreductase|nr:aldo/keto reductase [FCB group bacterium]
MEIGRRDFMRVSAAAMVAASLPETPKAVGIRNEMPYRVLGRTGEKVSLLGVGGYHIGIVPKAESVRIIRTAIDEGVNFLDNSWSYTNGKSEEYMGAALKDGYRDKVFLMTKHDGRDRKTAQEHLETSLRRLDLDMIDLWQFHEIVQPDDPEKIYTQGAIEFALEAQKQGKIRYIGFTGHRKPAFLNEMIDRGFAWDTVQMPENPFDPHYESFQKEVLPKALERNMGVIAMKTQAGGGLPKTGAVTVAECLRYAMTLPVSVVVSGMDSLAKLKENLATAKSFQPMNGEEVTALLERTQTLAAKGEHEGYKVTWHA